MTASMQQNVAIVLRLGVSLLGGYVFTWGVFSFGTVALVAAGVDYDEAFTVFRLLGFLVFLGVFLWTFVARHVPTVIAVLFAGGVLMTALAWALQNQLVQGG